jgi:PadR family transcriptional regulator PadR
MADDVWLSQVKRGLLEMCILNLLAQEHRHGYRLVKALDTVPGLIVTEGTIYPLLCRLKREGLVLTSLEESTQGPTRKVYSLSERGRTKRGEMNRAWRMIAKAVEEIAGAGIEL